MSNTKQATAIITASYILYLIDNLLEPSQKFKKTTIQLRQLLEAKTNDAQNKDYIELSNIAFYRTVEKLKAENIRIAIYDVVESLGFNQEDTMTEMFGTNFISYLNSFVMVQTPDVRPRDIIKESRIFTKALKKELQLVIFEYKKAIDNEN